MKSITFSLSVLIIINSFVNACKPSLSGCLDICRNRSVIPEVDNKVGEFTPKPRLHTTIDYNLQTHAASSKCDFDASIVPLPKYATYLMGITILLLTVLTITLGILFYRSKMRHYQVFVSQAMPQTTIDVNPARRYIKQSSQDMTLLNITSNQDDENSDKPPKNGESENFTTTPTLQNPLKIYKSVRKPVDHQMILREQMKKICEDALAKSHNSGLTASLKDLNKLLNGFDTETRKKSHENIAREKSASYPHLDIYDDPTSNAPVYDCLPTSNNNIRKDNHSGYLMDLSKEDVSEPMYINAKYL